MDFYDYVIIGNGIAGSSLAQYLGNNTSKKIAVISNEHHIPFARTALMYVATGQSTFKQIELPHLLLNSKNNLTTISQKVNYINAQQKELILNNNKNISFGKLIIATGAKPKRLAILENLNNNLIFYHKKDLDKLIDFCKKSKKAIIIGAGLIAIEIAEILHYYKIKTTIILKGERYWPEVLNKTEANIIENQIKKLGIEIIYNANIVEITKDNNQNIVSLIDNFGKKHNCDFVVECIGVEPNFNIEIDQKLAFEKGILINNNFETNIKDIYAIGDCCENKEDKQNSIWYVAQKSGIDLGKFFINKNYTLSHSVFSNSAKFFNIDFIQWGSLKNGRLIQWSNAQKSFSISLDSNNNLIGLQALGIKIRANIAQKMIENKIFIKDFLEQIESLNFEPEFNKNYWPAIKTELKKQHD